MRKLYEYLGPEQSNIQIMEGNDGKDLFMQGLFIQGDVKNQNGRVYPKDEIQRAVENVTSRLQGGETVMGELDHPEELQINLDRVSHIITEMQCDGSNGLGKLKIIDTPMGRLDGKHRTKLVENYFPNAAGQVILLSTDEEINGQYYKKLKPAIAKEYHIRYDDALRTSAIESGYFGGQL